MFQKQCMFIDYSQRTLTKKQCTHRWTLMRALVKHLWYHCFKIHDHIDNTCIIIVCMCFYIDNIILLNSYQLFQCAIQCAIHVYIGICNVYLRFILTMTYQFIKLSTSRRQTSFNVVYFQNFPLYIDRNNMFRIRKWPWPFSDTEHGVPIAI